MKIINFTVLLLALSTSCISTSKSNADCEPYFCDVSKFQGTNDERIIAAIKASENTNHKVVYFPNGNYYLNKSIILDREYLTLELRGESKKDVRLITNPIIFQSEKKNCFAPAINIDRATGFKSLNLTIKNITIDQSKTRNHAIYKNNGCSSGGHGIRVGNGWINGQLNIDSVDIIRPPGYGIGIQNSGDNDIPADNIKISNVNIIESGSDGLDTKKPPKKSNKNLSIFNTTINQIGFNDEGSAAGVDINYENFHLNKLTVITTATRENPKGLAHNTGIRLRSGASFGTIKNIYVKGGNHGIFFDGKNGVYNKNIEINNFLVKDFSLSGIYIRGENIKISKGCSFSSIPNSSSYKIDKKNSIKESIIIDNSFTDNINTCLK